MLKKIRFPIAVKLVVLTVTLLVGACFWIGTHNADVLGFYAQRFYEGVNKQQAEARARTFESLFDGYTARLKILGSLVMKVGSYGEAPVPEGDLNSLREAFDGDPDFVNLELWNLKEGKPALLHRRTNKEYLERHEVNEDFIPNVIRQLPWFQKSLDTVFSSGALEVRNSSVPNGAPLITFIMPLAKDTQNGRETISHVIVTDIRLDRIQKLAGQIDATSLYVLDQDGVVLAHPDDQMAIKAVKMDPSTNGVVYLAMEKRNVPFQQQKVAIDGDAYIAAFKRTIFGPMVVAQTSEDVILEPGRVLKKDVFILLGYILGGAFFLMVVFSITLTRPIEKLAKITKQVALGNFDVKSNIHTGDEVEELSQAFDSMIDGLKERDKIKNVMVKFHGSSVTDTLLTGELSLGGTSREVTVLFSDLRGFTKFSEGREPHQVVEMLNEYFQIMVSIINKNKGVVDKFIGDAIMAVWGAPNSSGDDAGNAVLAALQMRQALEELNNKRMARGDGPIKIGVGIHSGPAIAGQIGSDERMEYTVIGDTVNQSSRIEASTKAFGTDLLISEETQNIVKDRYIIEYAGAAEVKGKTDALKLFKVRGYKNAETGEDIVIKTEYSDYEAADADKVKIA